MAAPADRRDRRVDGDAATLRLDDGATVGSALHRRVVFVALARTDEAAALVAALAAGPNVRVAPAPSRLFAGGVDRAWGAFQLPSDVGVATVVSAAEFLAALRQLVDDLLLPALGDGDVLVEWSPEHATPLSVQVIASLYPDAAIVTTDEVARCVPADVRRRVVVASGSAQEQAGALLRRRRPRTRAAAAPSLPTLATDRLLVVVGCGRSGTTWFEELWLADPRVGGVARGETWIFHQLRHLWRLLDDDDGLSRWVSRADLVAASRAYCDHILGAGLHRHRPGATWFVEKSPVHAERLVEIAAVYPDAWVMHLLRDGRDVARSMSQVPFFDVPDIGDAATLWQRVVSTIRRDAPVARRFRDVRYEDLHADPLKVMRALYAWVELGVDPALEQAWRDAAGRRVSAHAGTAGPVGPGSWRALPAAELRRLYRACGRTLVAEHYLTRRRLLATRLALAVRAQLARLRNDSTASRNAAGWSTQGK